MKREYGKRIICVSDTMLMIIIITFYPVQLLFTDRVQQQCVFCSKEKGAKKHKSNKALFSLLFISFSAPLSQLDFLKFTMRKSFHIYHLCICIYLNGKQIGAHGTLWKYVGILMKWPCYICNELISAFVAKSQQNKAPK